MSESDEPFEILHEKGTGEPPNAQKVRKLAGKQGPVQVVPVEQFFKELTEEKSWHGEAEKADVRKYRNLLGVVQEHLPNAQVFRIGEIQVDVFILGNTSEGDLAGVKTKSIET